MPTFEVLIARPPSSNVVIAKCQYDFSPLSVMFKFVLFFLIHAYGSAYASARSMHDRMKYPSLASARNASYVG